MAKKEIMEFVELDKEKKWEYLKKYYEVTSNFYGIKDTVINDSEINSYIKKFKEKPLPKVRKEIKLREWFFKHDKKNEGLKKEYYSYKYDECKWVKVKIPHSYRYIPKNPIRYGKTNYWLLAHGKGQYTNIWLGKYYTWYKKRIKLNAIREDEIAYLKFDSANLKTDVWLNEAPVMINHLGPFPFQIEVNDEIDYRSNNNEIILTVRNTNEVSNVPHLFYNGFQWAYSGPSFTEGRSNMDWIDQAWSGLADDVTLIVANKNHIDNVFIYTEKIHVNEADIKSKINLKNNTWEKFTGTVKLEVSKWFPEEGNIVNEISEEIQILPMNNNKAEISFIIKNPTLWSTDDPNLYIAHIILKDSKGNEIDDMYETFGIRTVKIIGQNYYINNKKVILRGSHDITLYHNDSMICPSDKSIVKDILLHKKIGANCSRFPSDTRMHYKKIAQFADQMGYMLSWAGYFEVWLTHPEMELYAKRDVGSMVKSLRNNPSIVIWEMGDEPLQDIHHYRRYRWFESVYNLVKEEDESRPILPTGWFGNDFLTLILKKKETTNSFSKAREEIIQNFPVYSLKLAYWDIHHCPMIPPVRPIYEKIDEIKNAFAGKRLTVFTEFGLDAMPDWSKVLDVYGKFRWAGSPYGSSNKNTEDLNFFGRILSKKDWKETQACQSIVLSDIIGYLRENPKEFGAFYFMLMNDAWTFYWGLVDIKGNCKLSYFVVRNIFKDIYISGLHGNTILEDGKSIEITIGNFGNTLSKAKLIIFIKDNDNNIVMNNRFEDLTIKGDVDLTKIGKINLKGFKSGIYTIEYYLHDDSGTELAKMIELFFVK